MENLYYLIKYERTKYGTMFLIESLIEYGIITPNDVVEALLKYGSPIDILYCVEDLNIFPLDRLANVIIGTKNAEYIYRFVKEACYEVPITE